MRITTKAVYDIETGALLLHEWYEYSGPVALTKKNRKEKKALAQLQADLAKQQAALAQEAAGVQRANRARSDALIAPYESLGLGELSPLAQAELASENDEIRRVYGGIMQGVDRAIGARGFGRAPSGFASSAREGVESGRADAEVAARRGALGRSEEGRRLALGYRTGQQSLYDPTGRNTAASGIAGQAGESFDRVGSTFGDILSGIGAVGSMAFSPIPANSLFGKLGKKKPASSPVYTDSDSHF